MGKWRQSFTHPVLAAFLSKQRSIDGAKAPPVRDPTTRRLCAVGAEAHGLQYDPFQNSIDEARAFAARVRSDRLVSMMMTTISRTIWCIEAEEIGVATSYSRPRRANARLGGSIARGSVLPRTWAEAHEKVAGKVSESVSDFRHLRSWLRAKKERGDLGTHGLLVATIRLDVSTCTCQ